MEKLNNYLQHPEAHCFIFNRSAAALFISFNPWVYFNFVWSSNKIIYSSQFDWCLVQQSARCILHICVFLFSSTLWLFISLSSCYTFPISYGNLVLDQNNFTWYVWVFLFPVWRIINSYYRKRLRFDVTYGRLMVNQSRRKNSFRFVF